MGAENHIRWVRTEDIDKYDWSEGWINCMELPEEPDILKYKSFDDYQFDYIESIILGLTIEAGSVKMLKCDTDNSDYVFVLDEQTIGKMMRKCRSMITNAIWLADVKSGINTDAGQMLSYWYDDIPEDLCKALKMLGYAKSACRQNEGWSLIVELAW